MLKSDEVVVAGVDAELAIGAAKVFLEDVTALTLLSNDAEECIQARKPQDERLLEVRVSWNAAVDRAVVRSTEVDHHPRFACATVGDL